MHFFKLFYNMGDWLSKVMYLHLLWVLFTLLGLVIFGIFPATAALCSVIHRWYDKDFDTPIFKHFYAVYKTHFLKSNGLGIILISAGVFLYVDIKISKQLIQSSYLHVLILIITFLYFITVIYFFSVFIRYELKLFNYFKQSFLIAISSPFETLAIIISLFLLYYLFLYLPILLFFAGSAIIATPVVWFSYRACIQIERKLSG